MAENLDFKTITINDVVFYWPKLDQPYVYNTRTEKSEPCAASVQGAAYSIAFDMPIAAAKDFHKILKDHYAECKARNKDLPEFTRIFGMKKDEASGTVRFTAKRSAMTAAGKVSPPPALIDGKRKEITDRTIWSESTGNVRVTAFPSKDPKDKSGGISLLLDTVQLRKAVYGGGRSYDDFPEFETEMEEIDPPAPAARQPAAIPADAEF